MKISEPIIQDQVILAPNQPNPRVLTLPRDVRNPQSRLWDYARVLLLALLMLAPLAVGAVQTSAWTGIAVSAMLMVFLWAAGCASTGSLRIVWSPLYVPLLAVLILASVQLFAGISKDHIATREAVIKLLTYGSIFFAGQQLYLSTSGRTWRITFAAAAIYMFLMALFAMVQYFSSPGLLYGYLAESTSVFGPYVNHGNYAGLMELLIPMSMALAVGPHWRHPAKPFLLFMVFLAVVSVFLSGSRAGLISLAVEFAMIGIVLRLTGSDQKRILIVGIAGAALAVGLFYWLDPGDVWGRWQQMANRPELALQGRDRIALDTLRMSRDHLAYGVGLGAFQTAYTPYQTVVTELTIDYAHNDYAQFLAETGIWGWVILPLALGMFFFLAFRRLSSQLHHQTGWLQFGACVGVCGLLVHSISEFNLHIPANAAWFAYLVALSTLPLHKNRHAD